jgi:sulfate adenylyltransferase subunit 2
MDHLDQLEQQSVYIFREAFRHFERLCMLWSIGKDSTVLLWLARKAFFGHVPFPLVHIDTSYKLPEMIQYRDRLAMEYKLHMVVGQNEEALAEKDTFPDKLKANPGMSREEQAEARTACCGRLKSDALKGTLHGTRQRRRLDLKTGRYELDPDREPYTGVIVGARADEEGSRSKERYFSPRDKNNDWDVGDQPPEFWNQFKTDFAPGTHVRIHPLLDWTELHIWEYIKRENIPTVSLYYNQGDGKRYRSLGCGPCQAAIDSTSRNVDEIIVELKSGKLKNVAERSGRLQDGKHGLEELRRKGYM